VERPGEPEEVDRPVTSLAAGSVQVQSTYGECTTCLVKKTARAVVTTYW